MIKRNERSCYTCGESSPDKPQSSGNLVSTLLVVALVVALGCYAYTFFGFSENADRVVRPSPAPVHRVSAVLAARHG